MKKKPKRKAKLRPKMKHGATYRDEITGFEGIATGVVKYITGCDQVLLAPQSRDGLKLDAHWFDVARVFRIGRKVVKLRFASDADFDTKDRGADITPPTK